MTEDKNEIALQEYDESQREQIAIENQDYEEMIYNLCQEHGLVKRETLSNLTTALRDILKMYEDDAGCRELWQYKNAASALAEVDAAK